MYRYLFLLVVVFQVQGVFGQKHPFSLCEIKGEDVYINFHESCLDSDDEACMALAEFKQYDLAAVIKSGLITLWEKDGWTMQKTGANTYQLHKKLMHFDMAFNLEDKFQIDMSYWNYPVSERSKQGSSDIIDEPARVHASGNVEFKLKGKSTAKQVILSGSFNDWNEQSIKMLKVGDEWKIRLKMTPGIYEYKFIVDGEWMTDPANPYSVQNQHYTFNSILVVGKEEQFFLKGYKDAKTVALSGSFNNWDTKGVRCIKTKEGWKVTQKLPPGKHFYKFIIDEHNWIVDPSNNLQERDEGSNINSVIIVH
jgi:Glycogen recognition site of AMP-activated protein kinase